MGDHVGILSVVLFALLVVGLPIELFLPLACTLYVVVGAVTTYHGTAVRVRVHCR